MSTGKSRPGGHIDPGMYYPLHEAAVMLRMTLKTMRQKYVNTGKLRVATLAKGSDVVPGYELGRLFDELLGGGECDDDQGE